MTAKSAQEAHARLMATLPATTHVRHVELPYDPLTGRRNGASDSPSAIRNRAIAKTRKRVNARAGQKDNPR